MARVPCFGADSMRTITTTIACGIGLILAALSAGCTPSARAKNQTLATAIIEKAGAASQFADASTDDFAAIRHIPSGMLCVLPADGAFDFESFPQQASNQGAYCSAASNATASTLMVIRFSEETTLDRAFADGLAVSAGPASPRPWTGAPSAADKAPPEGLPHFRIARFEATIHGAPSYLRVSMGEAQGWYLQQIVSAPIDQAARVEAEAGESWRRALREFGANSSPEKE